MKSSFFSYRKHHSQALILLGDFSHVDISEHTLVDSQSQGK